MSVQERQPDEFADAFQVAFARLRIRVETACAEAGEWRERVAAGICAAFAFASADPEGAETLISGSLAKGRRGYELYDLMLAHFAEGLLPGRAERPEGDWLPEITERAMVGGLATLIANRLDQGAAAELPALASEAIQFVLTPYIGAQDARRLGAEAA